MFQYVENETGQTIVTATPFVAAILPGITTPAGHTTIHLMTIINLTPGPGTTNVSVTIRRGPVAGGQVVSENHVVIVTAGNATALPVQGVDDQGEVAGQQYNVTVVQTGATGNGAVNGVMLRAEW